MLNQQQCFSMPPFIYNKENGEMKEMYCSNKLSSLYITGEDKLVSRTYSAGNWYWNQGDILTYVQDYAIGLLTLGGSAYDRAQSYVPTLVDMIKRMPVITDNTIHELVYLIADTSVRSTVYNKCLGFITDKLMVIYADIITHLMTIKPKSVCIGRWFLLGVHRLSNNALQYNKMVMNEETIKH